MTDEQMLAAIRGSIALRDQSDDEVARTVTDFHDPHFWSAASAESFEHAKILIRLACPNTWRDSWVGRPYRWRALTPFSPEFAATQAVRAHRGQHPQVANWFFKHRFQPQRYEAHDPYVEGLPIRVVAETRKAATKEMDWEL